MSTTNRSAPDRRIWTHDFHRLEQLARSAHVAGLPVARFLLSELNRAIRYDSDRPPAGVVTLNNWVKFRISGDENRTECRLLVAPEEVLNFEVHLSVLSPLGAALVGLEVGSRISYVDLEGEPRLATVEAIGADNFMGRKGLEVGLCTILLLATWLALAFYFRS
jgi:regulator of nucleoside diphosphate kinase